MGRRLLWTEDMGARFPFGTFACIDKARSDGETRTDFVRTAVDKELTRRIGKTTMQRIAKTELAAAEAKKLAATKRRAPKKKHRGRRT